MRWQGRRLSNFTLRITRYDEPADSLRGTISLNNVTRRFEIPADDWRRDSALEAAILDATDGRARFYASIPEVRAALDALAFE